MFLVFILLASSSLSSPSSSLSLFIFASQEQTQISWAFSKGIAWALFDFFCSVIHYLLEFAQSLTYSFHFIETFHFFLFLE